MISDCPNCNQTIHFSDANKARILSALEKLPKDQTLRFKCPMCKEVIELNSDGFPPTGVSQEKNEIVTPAPVTQAPSAEASLYKNRDQSPVPPNAPDISWLRSGSEVDSNVVDNIMAAMIIVPDDSMRSEISEILKAESYQVYTPNSIDEAIESLRFKDYVIIVYHSKYENLPLKEQDFHKFMQNMSMKKRRYINYILIGPEFHSLYDLEALANSANIVINDNEIAFMSTILMKLKADYNTLFKSYCSILKEHGKT